MNQKEIEDRLEKLESGLSQIFDVVAKVSVETMHIESGGQSWSAKSSRVKTIDEIEKEVIAKVEEFVQSAVEMDARYRLLNAVADVLRKGK